MSADRYELDATRTITSYKARCPWCGNAPLFIHYTGNGRVLCDACDVAWAPEHEETLFVVHADKLAQSAEMQA